MSDGWDRALFRRRYVDAGGSAHSANSYVSYLNRAERVLKGFGDSAGIHDGDELIGRAERLPPASWGGVRERRDSLSALRCFVRLATGAEAGEPHLTRAEPATTSDHDTRELIALLGQAQALGANYYRLTGKPLGVTGEVAELEAARAIGLTLCPPRTPGYDGWLDRDGRRMRVQVKGRAVSHGDRYRGRCPSIRIDGGFDLALLVLVNRATLEAMEIWEADYAAIAARLAAPGSKARNERGSLAISQFTSIATKIWSAPDA